MGEAEVDSIRYAYATHTLRIPEQARYRDGGSRGRFRRHVCPVSLLVPAYVSIRQHTSAYVSIREHT